jgi:hypothetical protein
VTTLAQINALLAGYKPTATRELTDLHRLAQPGPHLSGVLRSYQPHDDEGEHLPAERQYPQVVVEALFTDVTRVVGRLFSLQLTQDVGNTEARADIAIGDRVLMRDVPVTFMLFLEKQLTDLRTFIGKLPVLDPSKRWEVDESAAAGFYRAEPAGTVRTKKVAKTFVKWEPPTPAYTQPAQVEVIQEDVALGTWTTVALSGAVPAARVKLLMRRISALIEAVKLARETANAMTVTDQSAAPLFAYLFAEE